MRQVRTMERDLFSSAQMSDLPGTPLAESLRPQRLGDVIGQTKVINQIRRFLSRGSLPSLIFWGPPGTGKTTLALSLSHETQSDFISINAVDTGAKNLKEIGDQAKEKRQCYQRQTILFIDEIHRLNKSQQDVLLSYVERGDLVLIGATTENPSYEINRALLSRSQLLVFERLTHTDLLTLAHRACQAKGFQLEGLLQEESIEVLFASSDGDARRLLNSLFQIFSYIELHPSEGPIKASLLMDILGDQAMGYDRSGDSHYDLISAFIKSVRGSDANAALYYLARMLKGGEDIRLICRRLIILASEDIGNADPRGIMVATAGLQAVEAVGLPEAAITLAQVTCYLSSAPKSNRSYLALRKAQAFVEKTGSVPVPLALRSSQASEMKNIGYGRGYLYPHDFERGWTAQNYWPESISFQEFYIPADIGFEKQIREFQKWLKGN